MALIEIVCGHVGGGGCQILTPSNETPYTAACRSWPAQSQRPSASLHAPSLVRGRHLECAAPGTRPPRDANAPGTHTGHSPGSEGGRGGRGRGGAGAHEQLQADCTCELMPAAPQEGGPAVPPAACVVCAPRCRCALLLKQVDEAACGTAVRGYGVRSGFVSTPASACRSGASASGALSALCDA